MLEAIFSEGITTVTVTGLTQWDYGRKLTIKGLSYTDNVEVHFSNNIEKEAVVMEVTKSGSDLVTEVPNVLLEKNHDITAWVYIDSGTSGETVRTINLKVKPRIKPADYISENNAKEIIDYVDEAKELLENATEQADRLDEIVDRVPDFDSYEKLAEHDHLLYDGLYVKGETYSGVASNKGIKLHSVKGKTVQQTTKGYQLFDASKLPTKTIGGATLTNNGDGSFTISGNGNLSEAYIVLYNCSKEESLKLLKVGIVKSNVENTIPQIRFGLRNPSNGTFVSDKYITSNKKSITLTEEDIQSIENGTNVLSFGFYASSGNTITPATVKPMVYIDGDGMWEPFTGGKPAPNPDYAMPIENVEISNINSGMNQLFDTSKISTQSQYGLTITNNNDGSLTFSGSGNVTQNVNHGHVLSHEETVSLLKSGFIKIVQDLDKHPYVGISGGYSSDGRGLFEINTEAKDRSSFEITQDMLSNPEFRIRYFVYMDTRFAITPRTVKPMVYQDGDGTWQPFKHATVETSLTLAQDDIYQQGTITRARKQVTFDGSSDESWRAVGNSRFQIGVSDVKNNGYNQPKGICNRLRPMSLLDMGTTTEWGLISCHNGAIYVRINENVTTVEQLRTWLQTHNLVVEYELATPTTEEFKVPTIPSYYPFTNVSTDNDLETEIQYEILANSDNSLYQEELEKRIEALEHAMLER